jgi:hypothetical protein
MTAFDLEGTVLYPLQYKSGDKEKRLAGLVEPA